MAATSATTQTHKPAKALPHIPELDGIRGIAAVVVFFHHACSAMYHPEGAQVWAAPIRMLSSVTLYWDSGVDLFFVLSGFLITSILLSEQTSKRYYRDFYIKRVLRIVPLYLVVLLLSLLAFHDGGYVLMALLFVVNFDSVLHVVGTGPFWTLAIEEQFYLLWPTVVQRLSVRQVRLFAVALGGCALVLRFVFALKGHHNYHLTFLRCDGLAFGAFLACQRAMSRREGEGRGALRGWLAAFAVAGVGLLAVLLSMPAGNFWFPLWQTGIVLVTGSFVGLSIAYSGAMVLGVLRSRVLTFFGLISYALYMVHIYVIGAYDKRFGVPAGDDVRGYFVRLGVTLAATVVLSVASRYVIELPAMGLRKKLLPHPNPTAEVEHPPLPLARM